MKAIQHLTDEQLRHARSMKPEQILRFLEDFRMLHGQRAAAVPAKSVLISLRVPEHLLRAFRAKAARTGVAYQRQIKRLMEAWTLERTEEPPSTGR